MRGVSALVTLMAAGLFSDADTGFPWRPAWAFGGSRSYDPPTIDIDPASRYVVIGVAGFILSNSTPLTPWACGRSSSRVVCDAGSMYL
jgi:hypothetical protein